MRKLAVLAVVLLLVVVGLLGSGYVATKHVPQFYRDALQVDPGVQQQRSDEMLERATALRNDLRQDGQWKAIFTAEQINGWLAVDMVENHPDFLPPEVSQPRVAVDPQRVTLAFRYEEHALKPVFSVAFDVYLDQPNVVALRIDRARAGALPVPLEQVIEQVGEMARQMDVKLVWRQTDGDPVALVTIPPHHDGNQHLLTLDSLKLGEGEIFVSGRTETIDPNATPGEHYYYLPPRVSRGLSIETSQR